MIKRHSRHAPFAAATLMFLTSLSAHGVPTLQFVPSDTTAAVGDSFSVDVFASDITDLFNYQALILFDPAILSANAITEGGFLSDAGTTVFFGEFSAENIVLISILLDPEAGVGASGSGVLATLDFTALVHGISPLTFSDVFLFNSFGEFMETETVDGSVTAVPEPSSLALIAIGLLAGCFVLRSRRWSFRA